MFLKNLFSKKDEISLLIDIGNGTISVASAIYKGNSSPYILTNTIFPISISLDSDLGTIVSSFEKMLNRVIVESIKKTFTSQYFNKKKHNKRVDNVLVSFSSPWFLSKTKEINITKDKEFIVTSNFLKSVLEKEAEVFVSEVSSSDEFFHKGQNSYIEKAVTRTKVNGYFVENSIGKKTKNLELSIYMSLVLEEMVSSVNKIIKTHIHLEEKDIYIHTFPFVSFNVLGFLYPKTVNYILMDITSEMTCFALVNNGTIVSTSSFPIGRNFIIKQISKVFGVSFEIAESFMHMFNKKKTDTNMTERMVDIFSDIEKEWAIYLEDSLIKLSPEMLLPTDLYITSEEDVAPIYMDFFNLSKNDSTSDFRKNLNKIGLSRDLLNRLVSFKSDAKHSEFIAILSLYHKYTIHR